MKAPEAATLARWRRLESKHFLLNTDQDPLDAEHTLRELEDYFAALTSVAFGIAAPPDRILVIGLATSDETKRYLSPCFDGIFIGNMLYQPVMVLGTNLHGGHDEIARHELVHYAMRLAYRRSLPKWFAEGMASYFETLAYDRAEGKLLFGRAGFGRIYDLGDKGPLLPVETLVGGGFDDRITNDTPAFYGSSWLLTHALIHEAPQIFTAYDQTLRAGATAHDAWIQAAPPAFRAGVDAWLTRYYRERRYEAGRRISWRAERAAFAGAPLAASDWLATAALLHAIGRSSQPNRAAWHQARALSAAALAVQGDPTQLEALQLQAIFGSALTPDRVRRAVQAREQSWVAWMMLADALAPDRQRRSERRDALARAAALAPDEPAVLLNQAGEALDSGRWADATGLFQRGLAYAIDEPRFSRGFLLAATHDVRCGAVARAELASAETGATPSAWINAAHVVVGCRKQTLTERSP